jgi:hypothetical protein
MVAAGVQGSQVRAPAVAASASEHHAATGFTSATA